ncbi:hypothetical protein NHX12_010737 [Muraenolepis orangiensis]|uniref:FH2 domain-containing protein n=1 Tax=Muraenolepis orangiensis TaxID=630683 RepID=A0A9Q0DKD0_9TELE|nr:hypothetical protein NHX12_010737 [Muraenolepis orangiensis]
MKKVNWDAIPSQCILGKRNVWTSECPQGKDLVLDIRSMEELFGHGETQAQTLGRWGRGGRTTPGWGHEGRESSAAFSKAPQVSILDSKKSMNIAIFLKTFRRPVAEMVEDILQGNWLRFGTGKLKELCKLLPENCDVKKLCAFTGNVSHLPEADQFMVQLVKVPGYEERLKAMMLREEFLPLMEELKNSVDVMTKAANELLDCDDLHSVIRLVLKAGNYMNAGGYTGNAIGFRMNSLLRLADTKANKPGMNLMHYVAKQAEDIDAQLLTFPSQLEHIGMASRICQEEVKAEFEREMKKIEDVKMYTSRQPVLLQQMETFLLRARLKLSDLSSSLHELCILSYAVGEYFCEDPALFKLEDCCSVFHSFCQKFLTAIQENRKREAVELRLKLQDPVHRSLKRRSTWSGREPRPPGKREASAEMALHSFLSAAPQGRCRSRRKLSPMEQGPLLELSILSKPPSSSSDSEEPDASLESARQRSPEKKQAKPNTAAAVEEDHRATLVTGNQDEDEEMRVASSKPICYQHSQGPGCPQSTPATVVLPGTPRSSTRDYFLRSNGPSSSPWTILSPFGCPDGSVNPRVRRVPPPRRRRSYSMSDGDDLDDTLWQTSPTLSFCSSTTVTPSAVPTSFALDDPSERGEGVEVGDFQSCSPDAANASPGGFVPERPASGPPSPRPPSLGPCLRSYSLDETGRSLVSGSWLGELIHKSIAHRTKSCSGSRMHPAKEGSSYALISFFRRIGSKCKPPD